ncbi:HAMP domain-containing protein [Defluviitalea raffinosedens]|uniref:histidine kinase n=2 Tax=Defluviitalea raffinosedens TaxID=1450156 RepID=A0A7C8HGN4_9FIRM|nr:HAMP domain-containing protein [Defluviitalea raffinosedens]HHW66682.1 cell wall metabolism sensor histidine kinase WalK [Candidatus Epulonipiscium sp.]
MLFSMTLYKRLENHYIEERKAELLRQANVTAGHIVIGKYLLDDTKKELFAYEMEQTSKEIEARVIVVDAQGFEAYDSNRTEQTLENKKTHVYKEILQALQGNDKAEKQSNNIINAAASIVDENKIIGAVMISAPIDDMVSKTLNTIRKQLYLLTILVSMITGILAFFASGIITNPLKRMLKVIQKITEGHLDQRIEIKGRDELAELGNAFNHMTQQLLKMDQSRQEFVSNVSHELKTPLSSIKVLSESLLFQEDVPVEMYKEFFKDINSEVDRLTAIINDLLFLVKLDQKEVPLTIKNTNLNTLIEEILKRLHPLANKKNIELIYESFRDVYAEVDEMKLTLAISNLVENGIKYTPEDGIVRVTVDADHQNAFIKVIDTGIGIPEEEQDKIFQRFYRVDKTRDRETGGTGLGLSITYRTVLLHQGSIKVNSKEGEGSEFIVRIPLKQSS